MIYLSLFILFVACLFAMCFCGHKHAQYSFVNKQPMLAMTFQCFETFFMCCAALVAMATVIIAAVAVWQWLGWAVT